ncbi:unnamed protein product (macronuclear) [Paramecium tetraurelia]|uniref:Uncharacterized protein n=1 Tax=Paramecium tetraurelia TaxID=5888 RepID=A0CQ54_PARTE|nr:uncharacterized protein GSPATT00009269001 [Paramecium tetraurelia]CAK72921.1 unnamed protein product [Paramecium tetraurelia]|eukprot:XP_001440318.1 hypothetical protein (macronuclear) [Paramecium tetraurelia strain d4-2]
MELEKTLYRVQERILTHQYVPQFTNICSTILLSMASINLLILWGLSTRNINQVEFDQNHRDYLYHYTIVDGDNTLLTMKYSSTPELLHLKTELLQQHNFTIININVDYNSFFESHLQALLSQATNLETVFLHDVAYSINSNIYVKNNSTNQTFHWRQKQDVAQNYTQKVSQNLWEFVVITLGLFISSAVSSLYIKITIICAPVIIIIMLEVSYLFGNRQIFPIFLARAFPWIGLYLNILDRTQRSKKQLIIAFTLMLFLIYFIYLSSIFIGSYLLFKAQVPYGLEDNFFGLVTVNEFASLLFLRTRTSLYFVPKFTIIFYYLFLWYVRSTSKITTFILDYGFYSLAMLSLSYACFGTFCLFIFIYEIPSLGWNPLSFYTPTLDRPRCYYLPVFSMNWVNELPQLWTMFYPLHGRRFFQIQNLALVDRNFPLLNNLLDIEMQEQQ